LVYTAKEEHRSVWSGIKKKDNGKRISNHVMPAKRGWGGSISTGKKAGIRGSKRSEGGPSKKQVGNWKPPLGQRVTRKGKREDGRNDQNLEKEDECQNGKIIRAGEKTQVGQGGNTATGEEGGGGSEKTKRPKQMTGRSRLDLTMRDSKRRR